jgi:hypothetical protein
MQTPSPAKGVRFNAGQCAGPLRLLAAKLEAAGVGFVAFFERMKAEGHRTAFTAEELCAALRKAFGRSLLSKEDAVTVVRGLDVRVLCIVLRPCPAATHVQSAGRRPPPAPPSRSVLVVRRTVG